MKFWKLSTSVHAYLAMQWDHTDVIHYITSFISITRHTIVVTLQDLSDLGVRVLALGDAIELWIVAIITYLATPASLDHKSTDAYKVYKILNNIYSI